MPQSVALAAGLMVLCLVAFLADQLSADPTHEGAWQSQDDFQVPAGLKPLRIPADNPMSVEKVELGKQLFFDPRLSRDDTVSCATCHDPNKGWSNGEAFATGVREQVGGRNSPTIINSAYQYFHFWDGRATGLEEQALGPIENPIEMDLTLKEAVSKINAIEGYRSQFNAVFGSEATSDTLAKAIAAFERTILSGDAPYDRFTAGDKSALSEAAQRGHEIFFNRARCSSCHVPPNFSDLGFHNIGIGIDAEKLDIGRQEHSKLLGDRGSFKTPTLREIQRTAPYMHDGSLATLADVVDFYVKGGNPNPQLDEEVFPLSLTDKEKADLVTFLEEAFASPNYPHVDPPVLPDWPSDSDGQSDGRNGEVMNTIRVEQR
ncbi:MAG: cytochrome-c peroxidase [Pirellulales bacterium]|nr:cytochrome-c peroxidase [Pirellulales bacterium]